MRKIKYILLENAFIDFESGKLEVLRFLERIILILNSEYDDE